jgi:hypothetical protein
MRIRRTAAAAAAALVPLLGATAAAGTTAPRYTLTHSFDAFSAATQVVRWNPCRTITYRINTAVPSSYRVTLVKRAVAKLSAATGLQFRYLGPTSYVPHYAVLHYPTGNRYVFNAAQQQAATGAQLVVTWAYRGTNLRKGQSNLLAPGEVGVGTTSWRSSPLSQIRILDAAVVLARGVHMKTWFAPGGSTGALLLHELGHAVGLQHVADRHQIMYPVFGSYSPGVYQSGDRAGLARVGRTAGCLATPALSPTNPLTIALAAGIRVTL